MRKYILITITTVFLPLLRANAQYINTIGGTGTPGYNSDGISGNNAQLNNPSDVVADKAGNVYVADKANNRIRKINSVGSISTFAGTGVAGFSGDGGKPNLAKLNGPVGLAFDTSYNLLYIADSGNHRIRVVVLSRDSINTIAGTGTAGYNNDNISAVNAQLNGPTGVATDLGGNIYIADAGNHRVRIINASGVINTYAGTGAAGYNSDNITAVTAQLNNPRDVVYLPFTSTLYIADAGNNRVRAVNPAGTISTYAGDGTAGYSGDYGTASNAVLNTPGGLATDGRNLYIADAGNNMIRIVLLGGVIRPLAGNRLTAYNGEGMKPLEAAIANPRGVAATASGNLYIADAGNHRVRMAGYDWYRDYENDGFGKQTETVSGLLVQQGYAGNAMDCNDSSDNPGSWTYVSNKEFSKGAVLFNAITTDKDGNPVVVYRDAANGNKATVLSHAKGYWDPIGPVAFTAGTVSFCDIAVDADNVHYVAFADAANSNKLTVQKYNGTSWVTVGTAGVTTSAASYISLAIDNRGTPYVMYNSSAKATVMKFDGSNWVTVGSPAFASVNIGAMSICFDGTGTPYIAFANSASAGKATVMKFDGSSWVTVGSAGFSSAAVNTIDIQVDGTGVPVVAYSEGTAGKGTVMKYNSFAWNSVGTAGFTVGSADNIALAIDYANNIFVAFKDGASGNKMSVMRYRTNGWAYFSAAGFSAAATGTSGMAMDRKGVPYVVYVENSSNKISVMSVAPGPNLPTKPVFLGTGTTCAGTPTVLDIVGGSLNDADKWHWYTGGCGGTQLSTNNSVAVSPLVNTKYYARAEGTCLQVPGPCDSITVVARPILPHTVTLSGSPDTTIWTPGVPVTISAHTVNSGSNPTYEWYRNGILLSGVTGNFYIAGTVQDGDLICVNVTSDTDCAQPVLASACTQINIDLSVKNVNGRNIFNVYPNPNNGSFILKSNILINGVATMEIINAMGQVVYTGQFSANGSVVNRQVAIDKHLESGIYMLRIRYNDEVTNTRLVIQ